MDEKKFIEILNTSINENKINKELLNKDLRFFRGKILLKVLQQVSRLFNVFDYRNDIIFENKMPFIKIGDIKLLICNHYYLKESSQKISLSFANTVNFLKILNIRPKIIIDIGACWGECSIYLASRYKNAKIFSIEGSSENYKVFEQNLLHNSNYNANIYPYNLILSDKDGYEEISNSLSTMNVIKKNNIHKKLNFDKFEKVKAYTLSSFLMKKKISKIDFVKIDIEGSELNLVKDLLKLDIKAMQIEIIVYNDIDKNLNFLYELSKSYKFHSPVTWKTIGFVEIKEQVKIEFNHNLSIDIYLSKK